jgi:hypothetical protein
MAGVTLILALVQALGAVIGAGGSVIGELAYFSAIRDGRISHAERDHLATIAGALRLGMLLLLVASIGLVIVAYSAHTLVQPAATVSYWLLMLLSLAVIAASWALARRKIPFALASGSAFTAWWYLAFLTLGQAPYLSLGAAIALYVVATAIISAVLYFARGLYPRVA